MSIKRKTENNIDLNKKQIKVSKMDNELIEITINESKNELFNNENNIFKNEIFIEKNLQKMIKNNEIEEGKSFTFFYGYGTISCIIWEKKNLENQIKKLLKLIKKNPNNFIEIDDFNISNEITWITFNHGSGHYPLKLAIKDLNNISTNYCSLNEINNFDSNHNLFKIIHLLHSLSNFFINIEKKNFQLPIFNDNISNLLLSEIIMDHLWIKNGNTKKNIFNINEFLFSPFLIDGPLKKFIKLSNEIIIPVFKLISQKILNLNKPFENNNKNFCFFPFKNIELLINLIYLEFSDLNDMNSFLFKLSFITEEILNWFKKNQNWPQIIWNNILTKNFPKENSIFFDCYNENDVNDFIKKINITGSSIYPNNTKEEETKLFLNKPFLILLKWKNSKLNCKIIFENNIVIGNIIDNSYKLNLLPDCIEKNIIIKNISKGFLNFCKNISQNNIFLEKKTILERTSFLFNYTTKKVNFYISIYNFIIIKTNKLQYSKKYKKMSNSLYKLLDLYIFQNKEKQKCWEIGVLFVALHKYLIKKIKSNLETNRNIKTFINEYIIKNNSRIWLFPYKNCYIFSLVTSFIFSRDENSIPTIKELCENKFMKKWIQSEELYENLNQITIDKNFIILNNKENREFEYINLIMNRSNLINSNIKLESEWRNTDDLNNSIKIIQKFTNSLKNPSFNCNLLRNRHNIPLIFISEKNNENYEIGQGKGVLQEGITLYWSALYKTGIFNINSKKKLPQFKNINSNHWYTLGFILNHCLLNNLSFFIDQPFIFFKLLYQSINEFTPMDIVDINRETAINLLNLFHLTDIELFNLDLFLEDNNNPLLNGQLTSGTVEIYINETCKKIIYNEYKNNYNNDNPFLNFEELKKGFLTTISDIRPSARYLSLLFSQNQFINYKLIIKILNYKNTITLEKHNNNCFTKKHILKNGSYCPLTNLYLTLKIMNNEYLKKFLNFITGSPLFNFSKFLDIVIIELNNETNKKYPTASTCIRTIYFYLNSYINISPEESLKNFQEELFFSLDMGIMFGIK